MDRVRLSMWLLWTLPALIFADRREDCAFYYLAQPPTDLPCNPYLEPSRFSVRVECVVAVNRSVGGSSNDFQIRWFAQLGSDSTPQEILNDNNTFMGVRIDQQPVETTYFYIYQSQARIANMQIDVFDRFWCQINVSDTVKESADISNLERSDQTIVFQKSFYTSPPLPLCPQQTFLHQTSLKCANSLSVTVNNSQQDPPIIVPSTSIPNAPPSPTSSCPPLMSEESGQTERGRLVTVLLPSLMVPVIVAILIVAAAVIMSCRRSRKPDRDQRKRKVGDGVSVENLATPIHISPPINATLPTEIEASLKEIEPEMMESLKAPPFSLRSSIKSNSNNPRSAFTPVPTTTTFAPTAAFKSGNRFSQDIYDDIADSALDSYSMSHNDIYFMQEDVDVPSAGVEVHVDSDRAPYINGLGYHSKAEKKDESKPLHYTNTALISISDRAAPTLVPKKTAASLPSLIDPKFYHESVSLQRRPNEAPGAVRGAQNKDLYDTLAKKKPDPTYYNQAQASGSRAALLVEDDEPDYDEVDEEDETTAKPRGRGNGVSGSKHAALNSKSAAHNKHMTVGKQNSVASESYEDMSGLEEFIDSYKSSTAGSVL